MLPAALSFTLLGAVESLLSAKVADGMTGRKHRYNMEVVAQGVANVASAIFGGISVTGTIARTATNIRAGACSPISGIGHAVFILVFMLVAGPLASFIPLSTLAGVLVVVCWNMAEKEDFLLLLRDWRGASVLMATFGLTLIEDLTFGIIAGCMLAAAFAIFDRVKRRQRAFLRNARVCKSLSGKIMLDCIAFSACSLIDARRRNARPRRLRFSQSLARRLHRPSHANVRSTTHRLGKTMKPFA